WCWARSPAPTSGWPATAARRGGAHVSVLAARAETSRRRTAQRDATSRTLISHAQLNRPGSKLAYRIVLTLVVVVFTLVFIGPLYFLFTDGLKSTQEAGQVPPTFFPAHIHPGTYVTAWNTLSVGRLMFNTIYYAFGALAF